MAQIDMVYDYTTQNNENPMRNTSKSEDNLQSTLTPAREETIYTKINGPTQNNEATVSSNPYFAKETAYTEKKTPINNEKDPTKDIGKITRVWTYSEGTMVVPDITTTEGPTQAPSTWRDSPDAPVQHTTDSMAQTKGLNTYQTTMTTKDQESKDPLGK